MCCSEKKQQNNNSLNAMKQWPYETCNLQFLVRHYRLRFLSPTYFFLPFLHGAHATLTHAQYAYVDDTMM